MKRRVVTVLINDTYWDYKAINPALIRTDLELMRENGVFFGKTDTEVHYMLKTATVYPSFAAVWREQREFWEDKKIFEEAFVEGELNYEVGADGQRIIEIFS